MDIVWVEGPAITPPCPASRPFGPCTQQCEQPSGHDGQHRAQCFAWNDAGWTEVAETGETVAAVSSFERFGTDLEEKP